MWAEKILYIDAEAIVLDKPAGLAVTPGKKGGESLEDYLDALRFGFQRLPSPVHRLDKDTSGCLLLSRNPKAHKRFGHAFEARRVEKQYVAVLDGIPTATEGTIDLPLAKISSAEKGWRMIPRANGQSALTHWRLLKAKDGRALVLFKPETGRTHQLRVHTAEGLGHPISGDPIYGAGKGPMLLHALSLKIERDGKPAIEAKAPLPPTFVQAGFTDADL
ncbi:RluA family pseudouridine synthase [Allosphingosinicella vermicomposti]|uniref:RluA family pseudouridine synthase n=1 Tax=Allosphingosinicella vermicomposti TaxID=614671 RepID=UPI003CC9B1A8